LLDAFFNNIYMDVNLHLFANQHPKFVQNFPSIFHEGLVVFWAILLLTSVKYV